MKDMILTGAFTMRNKDSPIIFQTQLDCMYVV